MPPAVAAPAAPAANAALEASNARTKAKRSAIIIITPLGPRSRSRQNLSARQSEVMVRAVICFAADATDVVHACNDNICSMSAPLVLSFDLDDTLWPVAPVIAAAERELLSWLRARYPLAVSAHDIESMRAL